jgi:membrane-associated phospholipid phosphatase
LHQTSWAIKVGSWIFVLERRLQVGNRFGGERMQAGAEQGEQACFVLRPQDVVLTLAATLCGAILVFYGRRVEGWAEASEVFALVAVMPWAFRAVQSFWPNETTRALATFIPPSLGPLLIYGNLNPLCDLLNPHLADAQLASVDLKLFGVHPGVWLEQRLSPHIVDALCVCYTSYYLWPITIGAILFFQREKMEQQFDRYILGYLLLMLGSYACYLMVPAIGPRFYLVDEIGGPLHATWIGREITQAFRGSPYFRDCFPSGHTALTLYCLYSARRLAPRWFWVILLPCCGLIASTLVCRFHYAIDVICGPLATVAAIVAADAIYQRMPSLSLTRERLALAFSRFAR